MHVRTSRPRESQALSQVSLSLPHNLPVGVLAPLFVRCDQSHDHQKTEGHAGSVARTLLSQVYPHRFCRVLARCLRSFLRDPHHRTNFTHEIGYFGCDPEQYSLLDDLFDLAGFSSEEDLALLVACTEAAAGNSVHGVFCD